MFLSPCWRLVKGHTGTRRSAVTPLIGIVQCLADLEDVAD
jgi:hypothetical protein